MADISDGNGLRSIKTTPSDGTVYFLYDAVTGEPAVEETYSGTSPTLYAVSAFGADGLRERCQAGAGTFTAFDYDPQGTLSDRDASGDHSAPCADIAVWDAYGQERSDQSSSFTPDVQYNENDPVGFEGQFGYYGDWEMPLASIPQQYLYLRQYPNLLTNRYYDPSTGKFASRDPIGTQGGENLYGYAGDDPVNEADPSGFDPTIGKVLPVGHPDGIVYRPEHRGDAPLDENGKPIDLHHVNQDPNGVVDEMIWGPHRGPGNMGRNHPNKGPSGIDRGAFRNWKRKYWQEQWDAGRFKNLPAFNPKPSEFTIWLANRSNADLVGLSVLGGTAIYAVGRTVGPLVFPILARAAPALRPLIPPIMQGAGALVRPLLAPMATATR